MHVTLKHKTQRESDRVRRASMRHGLKDTWNVRIKTIFQKGTKTMRRI